MELEKNLMKLQETSTFLVRNAVHFFFLQETNFCSPRRAELTINVKSFMEPCFMFHILFYFQRLRPNDPVLSFRACERHTFSMRQDREVSRMQAKVSEYECNYVRVSK